MRLKQIALAGIALMAAVGLAACDGTENNRTIPTAPAGYTSPALIGSESHEGAEESHGEGTTESEGAKESGAEPEATTAAE